MLIHKGLPRHGLPQAVIRIFECIVKSAAAVRTAGIWTCAGNNVELMSWIIYCRIAFYGRLNAVKIVKIFFFGILIANPQILEVKRLCMAVSARFAAHALLEASPQQ